MIGVRGVSDDAFFFLVERVHGAPRERDAPVQNRRALRQAGVLPSAVVGFSLRSLGHLDGEPTRLTEIVVCGHTVLGDQNPGFDVTPGEVGDRVAARLV